MFSTPATPMVKEQDEESTPTTTPLAQGFQLAGLGQLIAGIQAADRYLEFPA